MVKQGYVILGLILACEVKNISKYAIRQVVFRETTRENKRTGSRIRSGMTRGGCGAGLSSPGWQGGGNNGILRQAQDDIGALRMTCAFAICH